MEQGRGGRRGRKRLTKQQKTINKQRNKTGSIFGARRVYVAEQIPQNVGEVEESDVEVDIGGNLGPDIEPILPIGVFSTNAETDNEVWNASIIYYGDYTDVGGKNVAKSQISYSEETNQYTQVIERAALSSSVVDDLWVFRNIFVCNGQVRGTYLADVIIKDRIRLFFRMPEETDFLNAIPLEMRLPAGRQNLDVFNVREEIKDVRDLPTLLFRVRYTSTVLAISGRLFGELSFGVQLIEKELYTHNTINDGISLGLYVAGVGLNSGALSGLKIEEIAQWFKSQCTIKIRFTAGLTTPGRPGGRKYMELEVENIQITSLLNTDNQITDMPEIISALNKKIMESPGFNVEMESDNNDDLDDIYYSEQTPERLILHDNEKADERRIDKVLRRVDSFTILFFGKTGGKMMPFENTLTTIQTPGRHLHIREPLIDWRVDHKISEEVMDDIIASITEVQPTLEEEINQPEPGPEEIVIEQQIQPVDFDPFYVNIGQDSDLFGCLLSKTDRIECNLLKSRTGFWVPTQDNYNNCVFHCLLQILKECENHTQYIKTMRTLLSLNDAEHVKLVHMDIIAEVNNLVINVYGIKNNEKQAGDYPESWAYQRQIIGNFKTSAPTEINNKTRTANLFISGQHMNLITKNVDSLLNRVKCSNCYQWHIKATWVDHAKYCRNCFECKRGFMLNKSEHLCIKSAVGFKRKIEEKIINEPHKKMRIKKERKRRVNKNSFYFADIEAFPDPTQGYRFVPYAVALGNNHDSEVSVWYGKGCMKHFFNALKDINGTLWYYNGSGFDNYLHIYEMLNNGIDVPSDGFIKAGSRIFAFNHHKKLKVRDLFLFMAGASLSKACKDWKVSSSEAKTSFDHEKIYSWYTADEHQVEVTDYLRQDVKALRALYNIYNETMYKCFKMEPCLCVTPGQFAIGAWGTTLPKDVHGDLINPRRGAEEDFIRQSYLGGRVFPQVKSWESVEYLKYKNKEIGFDEIKDYLIMIDCNSLYPTAQVGFDYNCGSFYVLENLDTPERLNSLANNKDMYMSLYDVALTCPKDLITPFVMHRDEKGIIVADLLDKKSVKIWGVELEEAILLGYRVTKVNKQMSFTRRKSLFEEYVNICWQGRKNNPKPSLLNLAYKMAMNILTGKFGQKTLDYTYFIHLVNRISGATPDMLERIVDWQSIDTDNLTALFMKIKDNDSDPKFPIHLSAQILAHARVLMSQCMRACNAYLDPSCAMYYTDTDSLVLPSKCAQILIAKGIIGEDLGQFSDDLEYAEGDRTTIRFAKILKCIFGAPKGPYSIVYTKGSLLYEKIRIKGIPHTNAAIPHTDIIEKETLSAERIAWLFEYLENPEITRIPSFMIGTRLYYLEDDEGYLFSEYINYEIIHELLYGDGKKKLYCFFGSMSKGIISKKGKLCAVEPKIITRGVLETSWWSKGKREFNPELHPTLSFPIGYVPGRKTLSFNNEMLIRMSESQ